MATITPRMQPVTIFEEDEIEADRALEYERLNEWEIDAIDRYDHALNVRHKKLLAQAIADLRWILQRRKELEPK